MKIYSNIPELYQLEWVHEYIRGQPESNDIVITKSATETIAREIITESIDIDVICEKIRKHLAVHVFGDSHSIITHRITLCRENWLGFNTKCPLTMNRFGNEGLDLFDAIKQCGNGHEKYPVRPGDYVMYSYGEIDVRYLLLRNPTAKLDSWTGNKRIENMDNLIDKYISRIKENEIKYKCKSIVYNIIPPAKITNGANLTSGTLSERIKLYKLFTEELYTKCRDNDILVLDITDKLIGDDSCTHPVLLQKRGDIHLKTDYYHWIRDALLSLLFK